MNFLLVLHLGLAWLAWWRTAWAHESPLSSSDLPTFWQQKRKWTSMLSIDPSKVLTTLIKRGGLFIPKSVEKDLDVMRAVFSCESAELNVVDKFMVLHGFRLGLPNRSASLRIQRVYVHWDSYRKPTLDIAVDGVDLYIQFTNLMLTRNNWNELQTFGFPPTLSGGSSTVATKPVKTSWWSRQPEPTTSPPSSEASSSDFVRFNDIDLSGNATVHIQSRPLDKELGIFTVDMDLTDEITRRIQERSATNVEQTGRLGCNTAQLSYILQSEINKQVIKFISNNLQGIIEDPGVMSRGLDSMLNRASESIVSYASQASHKKGNDLSERFLSRLEGLGVDSPREKIAELQRLAEKRYFDNRGSKDDDTKKRR